MPELKQYDPALVISFIHAVEQMRRFQKAYFKNRFTEDLKRCVQWEREVDRLLQKIEESQSAKEIQGHLL